MKKNILIGVLAALVCYSIVIANGKASEAELQRVSALENLVVAMENENKAKVQEQAATKAAAEALIARRKVEELQRALEVCK
ncbi:MAG: hypothetical protein R8N23_04325 [Reichenbachiella sp.]|uniref:hypothetical protein n=1 Tax=Reichenbachiella sp. TaxID=2184521 RepID=UPI00296733A2|nr:hypothetical protein [Reichenbachiella sp.]MDW3209067.1 hypothetical protein [Reichenbachiella sp.]